MRGDMCHSSVSAVGPAPLEVIYRLVMYLLATKSRYSLSCMSQLPDVGFDDYYLTLANGGFLYFSCTVREILPSILLSGTPEMRDKYVYLLTRR